MRGSSRSPSRRRRISSGESYVGGSGSVTGSSERKARPSRVLRELALSERAFSLQKECISSDTFLAVSMRAEISRLLDCPDFAGLSRKSGLSESPDVTENVSVSIVVHIVHIWNKSDLATKACARASEPHEGMSTLDPPFSPVNTSNPNRSIQTRHDRHSGTDCPLSNGTNLQAGLMQRTKTDISSSITGIIRFTLATWKTTVRFPITLLWASSKTRPTPNQ